MTFHWRPVGGEFDEARLAAEDLQVAFRDQADAEMWLTGNFDALLEAGVTEVSLVGEGGEVVYGPMSLEA